MSVFARLFVEFPRARIQILSTELGMWTQVNIPGIPSMRYTDASPHRRVRVDETEYVDFNREPLAVIQDILQVAKKDREDVSRGR